ncbi:MAG: alpha/beta hydrolase [Alphaproteobacteria bacterium]|nr:alpha/beta hydrolase [Alphaproteobacteria bacterium]
MIPRYAVVAFRRPAESHTIRLPRLAALHYLDWPGSNPPIILLHGNKSLARSWDFMVDASTLANRYLAPDHRGHGLSAAPERGYRIADYIADAWEWIAALGLGQVILVGTATGGYMALQMANDRPDVVKAIVVVDSGIWLPPAINFALRRRRYPNLAAGRAALDRSEGWPEEIKDHYARHSFKDVGGGEVEYRYVEQGETAASRAEFHPETLCVRCPVLVVRGERSDITSVESIERLMALIGGGARAALVPDCGHHIPMDRPADLAAVVDDFVLRLA